MTLHSRGMLRPRFIRNPSPFEKRARGMPGAQCTRSLVRAIGSQVCARVFTAEAPETSGIPHAMVLRLTSRSPRGPCFLAPVIGAMRMHRRPLGISVGMPGPHDFAVRPERARLTRHCGHRIPLPTFMTIAKRPSCGGGTGGANHIFLKNRSEIFGRGGLERRSSLKGLGKLHLKISA